VKAFRFRLRHVLIARQRVEDERAVVLGVRMREKDAAGARVRALEGEMTASRDTVAAVAAIGTSGAELRDLALGAEATRRTGDRARARLREISEATEAARARLIDAARARRALERLEEQQRAGHAERFRRAEQCDLDDVATSYVVWRDTTEPARA
jgi:flagellar export protein FliJ